MALKKWNTNFHLVPFKMFRCFRKFSPGKTQKVVFHLISSRNFLNNKQPELRVVILSVIRARNETNLTLTKLSSDFVHHSFDYRSNWAKLSTINIMNMVVLFFVFNKNRSQPNKICRESVFITFTQLLIRTRIMSKQDLSN